MKRYIFVSILFPLIAFGQSNLPHLTGTYQVAIEGFFYQLELKKDSTFTYTHSFELGGTTDVGNWRAVHDTLVLFNFTRPWPVCDVIEKRIDSLQNKVLVEIKFEKYDINDQMPINIWINGNCNDMGVYAEKNIAIFNTAFVSKIETEYSKYIVKNGKNNYFVITFSGLPILGSPPPLKWEKWLIQGDTLSPLGCDATDADLHLVRQPRKGRNHQRK